MRKKPNKAILQGTARRGLHGAAATNSGWFFEKYWQVFHCSS
jgi:hypothetical protein